MILNKCGTHNISCSKHTFISSECPFHTRGVVTTFQVYIIIVFFMTTMVNMLTKSENFRELSIEKNSRTEMLPGKRDF